MSQTNDDYILKTFERLGFGEFFNVAYLQGKEQKLPEIPFQPGKIESADLAIVILPKVVEDKKNGDGFYVMKGYQATLQQEGKADVSQFIQVYKSIGLNIDQAELVLKGRAVRYKSGYKDNKPTYSFTQLNFEKKTESGNFQLRRRADDGSLLKALGPIGIIGDRDEREMIYQKLQIGERVGVNVRDGESSKRLFIQAATRKAGLAVDLFDPNGILLKQYPEAVVRKLQPVQAVPDVKKIPDNTVKTLKAADSAKVDKPKKSRLKK